MFSLLLHLYQPPYQTKKIFEEIYEACYFPLLKLIKQHKDFRVSLNIPLSVLAQFEEHGYGSWIADLKVLVDSGRVELVGSGAYHPILTKIPSEWAENQIIFNEYGLGYYFGRHQNFEGETAIVMRDLNGFFPPELALNNDVLSLLDSLGYMWVLAEHTCIDTPKTVPDNTSAICKINDLKIRVVTRNSVLSNVIAFSDGSDIEPVTNFDEEALNSVVALDAETFGHHNSEGISYLHQLLSYLPRQDITTGTVSEYLSNNRSLIHIGKIKDSSWGLSELEGDTVNPYPLWHSKDNTTHNLQWELLNKTISLCKYTLPSLIEDKVCKKAWEYVKGPFDVNNVEEDTLIAYYVSLLQCQNSDQFWWASKHKMPDGSILFDKETLLRSLSIYNMVLHFLPPEIDPSELESLLHETKLHIDSL